MNTEYRILIKQSKTIKGGTCIPMTIPACFREDKSNFFIGEIHNFKNLLFGKRLNNYGACRFDILVDDVEANSLISLCEYEVYIYKVTSSGDVLVWSGEQRRRTGSLVENHDDWCTIYCYDWLYALKDRYTASEVIYAPSGNEFNITGLGEDNNEIGSKTWDNPSYIQIESLDNNASIDFGGTETITHYLKATNFGFTIPDNGIITGIEVAVTLFNDKGYISHYAKDSSIKIIKNGVISTTNLGNNTDQLTTPINNVIYGSNSNLWGESFTPDDINASNFGVALSYTGYGSIINIYYVKIKVYYGIINGVDISDAGAIAWNLIETSQLKTNGNLGITEGTIATTQDRVRTYNNQNIMEAIINLSDVINGFDFEITDDKIFNVYTVKGTDLTDSLILEYGRNLQNVSVDEDFTTPCNNAIVLGEVVDDTELSRVDRPDTTTQAKYKLREMVLSADNVIDENTLAEKGDAMLYKYKEPLIKVTFEVIRGTVDITQFSLGDLIRLIIKKGCYNIDSTYRIFEWTINHENDNTEKLSLILGELGI